MSGNTEIIKEYDVLFAIRTGVTVLVPPMKTLDGGVDVPVHFNLSPDNKQDVVVTADGRSAIIKDMRKDYLEAALERGTIMFYEMKDDEVVRCTPCTFKK